MEDYTADNVFNNVAKAVKALSELQVEAIATLAESIKILYQKDALRVQEIQQLQQEIKELKGLLIRDKA
ncbi:MAG: hypothetical protein FWE18_00025 [Alphaproteobacteria bacterium]|nr:hypothetical protein [Alphaproteobacteria bacterium]